MKKIFVLMLRYKSVDMSLILSDYRLAKKP